MANEPDVCERYHGGSETSEDAHRSVSSKDRASLRNRILKFIDERGDRGATCDEIEVAMELRHQTASARVSELKRDGKITASGRKRPTRSGRGANVYVLPKGQRELWG